MAIDILSQTTEGMADSRSRPYSDVTLEGLMESVKSIRQFTELTGLPFMLVDPSTGMVLAKSEDSLLPVIPQSISKLIRHASEEISVVELPSGLIYYIVPLTQRNHSEGVAVGYVLSGPDARPNDLVLAAAEHNWSQRRFDDWIKKQSFCRADTLRKMLDTIVRHSWSESREEGLQVEIDDLSEQIEQTFEQLSLLHTVTSNLQISRCPVDLAALCLERMEDLVQADGKAIWLKEPRGEKQFLIDGTMPFDEIGMARLISRFESHDWSRPLVKNHIAGSLLGADFPGLKNLVISSIAEGENCSGWIICCNESNGKEFGSVEASLLNSIATILGTHLRNIDLYRQHDELLLSFVKSLVSTLDAKDPYTRGHSERVALIARRLGQEIGLPEQDLKDIYLSGLVHDIGKIGVNDQVLQKPGKLTDEEFKHIQRHPMIGYNILKGLKNLQHILPGVRSHHETYNGRGYPDGLKGEETPLMARIMAVADSYDAMGSDRPYRKGMPVESIEEIFKRGAGEQWDAKIIDAYFRAREDVIAICRNYEELSASMLQDAGSLVEAETTA